MQAETEWCGEKWKILKKCRQCKENCVELLGTLEEAGKEEQVMKEQDAKEVQI